MITAFTALSPERIDRCRYWIQYPVIISVLGGSMRLKRMVNVVGAHAEGEVGNVVTGGIVDVPGRTMFEKMEFLRDQQDDIRQFLLFEPRGGPCQAFNVLLPSNHPDADLGFVIMEANKYPPMSGSNTLCVATVILESGIKKMIEPVTVLRLESPGGLIEATCSCRDGRVEGVEITMLPSFTLHRDVSLDVKGLGSIKVSVAYGGIFFAVVDASSVGLALEASEVGKIGRMGLDIREACARQLDVQHPLNPRIKGVTNVLFNAPLEPIEVGYRTKNAVMCGTGRLDRSPCGTGNAARLAMLHETNEFKIGDTLTNYSIFGGRFEARIQSTTTVGRYPGVIPTIKGRAWLTGFMQYTVDETDPFSHGHTPNDVWHGT
jgi:proline racemase